MLNIARPISASSFSTDSVTAGEQAEGIKTPVQATTPRPEPSGQFPAEAAQPSGAGSTEQEDLGDVQIGWMLSQQQQQQQERPLVLAGGVFVLPHPDKIAKGGEDWYFIASSQRAMGIADGVGGWAEVGVDAGLYARMLMRNACEAADAQARPTEGGSNGSSSSSGPLATRPSPAVLSAQDILEVAYGKTTVMGSSTACVMVLNGSTLTASNLGDSGFMVVRGEEMVMATQQQQHSFNFPFQIGGPDAMSDHPRQAERYEIKVKEGDIIIAGTDGLWDNCFHEEIVSVMKYCRDGNMGPERAAQVLAHYARHRASDTKFASPFSYSAYQAGIRYMGGKLDDITVVIAYVQPVHAAPVASKL